VSCRRHRNADVLVGILRPIEGIGNDDGKRKDRAHKRQHTPQAGRHRRGLRRGRAKIVREVRL